MRVIARHRTQPIVVLDDDQNTVLDTEDLEVLGSGAPDEGPDWELFPEDDEVDPRWEEIVTADAARLDVEERPAEVAASAGPRSYRAPKFVRNALVAAGLEGPASEGLTLTLEALTELGELELPAAARSWTDELLERDNVSEDELALEAELFALAEPELDFDEIDAACELGSLEAAGTEVLTVDADQNGVPDLDGVKVIYLAEIEREDIRAVQDLFAVVSSAEGAADVYRFENGGWAVAPEFAERLRSPSPPPVRELDEALTAAIIQQITATDEEQKSTEEQAEPVVPVEASGFVLTEARMLFGPDNQRVLAIVAAGGADRNRGNAETLRRYWTAGPGGAKIRWGTGGDWTRCRRMLSKHLGARAAGYCALRHHEMTGMWTGDKAHRALS